jgi:hypothetical protein
MKAAPRMIKRTIFPVLAPSMGVPPMMEITTTRIGWNRFAFLRKEGSLNIKRRCASFVKGVL